MAITNVSALPRPPGPRGLPVLGSLLKLRGTEAPHLALSNLARPYGDVCMLRLGSIPVVVIGHPDLMREAFDQHQISERWTGEAFSCLSATEGLIFSSYNEHWQNVSNLAQRELWSPEDVALIGENHFVPAIDRMIDSIGRMADAGDTVPIWDTLFSGNFRLTFRTLFGSEADEPAEFLQLAADLEERIVWFNIAAATQNPADFFLWTRFLPSKMLRESRRQRTVRDGIISALVDTVQKRRQQAPQDVPCLVDIMLAREDSGEISRPAIHALCMDVLVAVPAGVAATVSWFLLLLANRPDVQAKIHEEMDAAFENGASPSIDDRMRLPYTFACIAESMRYRTISTFTLPHKATQDTAVGGYRIPANTQVIGNIHGVHHDPRFWESPDEFIPERFLSQNGDAPFAALTSPAYMPFSIGIRRCTGDHFALNAFWLHAVRMMRRLRFDTPDGAHLPEDEVFGLSVRPRPYALRATSRRI